MKISYNWLQSHFEEKLPAMEVLSEKLIFHAFEVEDIEKKDEDYIFEVKILPDRAHDCLSHRGIAREVSAILDIPIKQKELIKREGLNTNLEVGIESRDVRRYTARIVRNVKVEDSPLWLKNYLNTLGERSVNNIVDIANFVLFDIGQPVHVFDLDKLESPKIIVKKAKDKEEFTTLDGKVVELDSSMSVICDTKDPLVIAGVKGGKKAEVTKDTKNILIEVANFDPINTRKTSRKLGLITDSARRFENDITPDLCMEAMDIITNLIIENAEGSEEKIVDIYDTPQEKRTIKFSGDYINNKLGSEFTTTEIKQALTRLSFEYEETEGNFVLTVPAFRLDIKDRCDIPEEVGRILGYDKILPKKFEIDFKPKINEKFQKIFMVRKDLLEKGYNEVINYSFVKKGKVSVARGLKGKEFLRTNLTDGLKDSYELNRLNAPLLGLRDIKLFEIGTVFTDVGVEEMHFAYIDKSGVIEDSIDNYKLELEDSALSTSSDYINKDESLLGEKDFHPWSVYPFITRDIALWVPNEVKETDIIDIIKENAGDFLARLPYLFDKFEKDGKTSFAFRLVFQSENKTLTDDEINKDMENITKKLAGKDGFIIR